MAQREPERRFEPDGESSQDMLNRLRETLGAAPREDTVPLNDFLKGLEQPEASTTQNPTILPGSLTDHDWVDINRLFHRENPQPITQTPSTPTVPEAAPNTESQQPPESIPLPPGTNALARIAQRLKQPANIQIIDETAMYSLAISLPLTGSPEYRIKFTNPNSANPNPIDIISDLLLNQIISEDQRCDGYTAYQIQQIQGNLRTLNSLTKVNDKKEWVIQRNDKNSAKTFLGFLRNYLQLIFSDPSNHVLGIIESCINDDMKRIEQAPLK